MKNLLLLILVFLFHAAFATVDGHDRVHIVVQDVQTEAFFVERVPIIGCYGSPQGARLLQFTGPYLATQNIGCGSEPVHENINYLTCAKVKESKESEDYSSFSEITLDISGCAAKDEAQFITMVRTAAKYNFPQKSGKDLRLNLLK